MEVVLSQKEEIQSQTEQLSDLNSLKDKLFSIISHDLRSPLVSLISLLELTKNENFTKEQFYALIGETQKNVNYTTSLVDNLLRWANSQQKGLKINKSVFYINEIIDSQIKQFNPQSSQKNIQIINNIPIDFEIHADKDMIRIVCRNLISNALKFSKEGSEIVISASEKSGFHCITVKDNGVGISKELLKTFFNSQLNSTRGTNNEKGTGLGLILCKDFVELNGGTISAESELEKGSAFMINLPVLKS